MSAPATETDSARVPEADAPRTTVISFLLALVIGIIGIGVIAFTAHWAAIVVYGGTSQLALSAVTPVAFFLVLLLALGVNPLLKRLSPRLALGRGAMLMVLAMWLLAGAVAYEFLSSPVVHAIGNAQNPAIRSQVTRRVQLDTYFNPLLFLPRDKAEEYYYGLTNGSTRVRLSDIPWKIWLQPLLYWAPFLIVVVIFSSTLVQVFHRQWSKHELLTYPIASFADTLLETPPKRLLPAVFYDKVFWMGFGVIAFIYTLNGLRAWFPLMVEFPMSFSEIDLLREFPFLSRYCGTEAYSLFRGWAYPLVIALAVFLPAEISFTCWFGWILMVTLPGVYFLLSGERIGKSEVTSMQVGMYVTMLAGMLIIGRREYWSILKHAVTFARTEDAALRAAAWAARVFVVAFAALIGLLMIAGMDLFPAFVMACAFALMVILIARITAEIGLPWLTNFAGTTRIISQKFLGTAAFGPKGLAVMAVVGALLDMNTSNSVAAQETTYRKLHERPGGLPRWTFNAVLLVALLFSVGAAFAADLWNNYSFGSQKETTFRAGLANAMERSANDLDRLVKEGRAAPAKPADASANGGRPASLLTVGGATGIPDWKSQQERFSLVRPEPKFWRYFVVGGAVIGMCVFMRLRFTWWPLHPLPFLFIDTWAMSRMYFSFFLAWVIKSALLRIGGGKVFNRSKPFFVGVIVGLIVMVMFWQIVGIVYYLLTETPPPANLPTII